MHGKGYTLPQKPSLCVVWLIAITYWELTWVCGLHKAHSHNPKQVFRVKKLVGRRGAPELELLAVVIVLFAPILHESLTNSNFVTNTI